MDNRLKAGGSGGALSDGTLYPLLARRPTTPSLPSENMWRKRGQGCVCTLKPAPAASLDKTEQRR